MAKTFIYTVEQAVKDGKYIDCTEAAKRAEYLIPVYVTPGVWKQCDCDDPSELWDLLQYVRDEMRKQPAKTIDCHYKGIEMRAAISHGPIIGLDDVQSFLAIFLPEED